MYSLVLKSSETWKAKSSSEMNKLNTEWLFETENEYGFPVVQSTKGFVPKDLTAFNLSKGKKALTNETENTVHFFLDDYKFEQIWTRPKDFIGLFETYNGIITPTFSVWDNQPMALNLFNVYRSRWCCAFYQWLGIPVLIDVRWAGEDTYSYCFSGIEKGSPVIVNTVGTKMLENRKLFVNGFYEMLKRIEPEKLFVYGEYMPVEFEKYFSEVIYYESFWQKQRAKIGRKRGRG